MSWHVPEFWRGIAGVSAWSIAAAWCVKTTGLLQNLPRMPNLSSIDWKDASATATLTVVVPARDEAANIAATLEALLAADYPHLLIIAVNDRSEDSTGAIMEEFAARAPDRLKVIHVTSCPSGWMGKTHALDLALRQITSDFVLFTDADVLFSPSILRRAMAYAATCAADHLVVVPTMQVKSRGEGIVLGFFQILGMWAARPWKVSDPTAHRDAIGVGAFNLFRRSALQAIGGLEPQRMVVLEDITLGWRIKAAGLRQRVAFAPGLVLVHWAKGARGLVRVMTKNLFSGVNFRPLLLLGGCLWIVLFCLLPLAGLAWWETLVQSLLVLLCMAAAYRSMGALSGIDPRYGWLYPAGACVFIYAMLRSMLFAWMRRGVEWRGSHYPLAVLRKHNSPLQWRKRTAARVSSNR